jgi:hypothetical protein
MIVCFHCDHSRLTATQKSLSNRLRIGRGRRRFSTVNCCRSTKFSKPAELRLPYTAVHDPQFILASSATFLHEQDCVIGITAGTVAKAYPAAILSQHGLVEDQSPLALSLSIGEATISVSSH